MLIVKKGWLVVVRSSEMARYELREASCIYKKLRYSWLCFDIGLARSGKEQGDGWLRAKNGLLAQRYSSYSSYKLIMSSCT